jgi:hypothetical protein
VRNGEGGGGIAKKIEPLEIPTILKNIIFYIYHFFSYYNYEFEPEEVELFNRWLYVPRADKQPRVLIFPSDYELDYRPSKFLHFIDGSIKLVIFILAAIINSYIHI